MGPHTSQKIDVHFRLTHRHLFNVFPSRCACKACISHKTQKLSGSPADLWDFQQPILYVKVAQISEALWCPRHAFAPSIVVPLCFSQFDYLFICLLTYYVIVAELTFHFQFSHTPSLLGRFMNPLFGLDLLSYVGTLIFWRFR